MNSENKLLKILSEELAKSIDKSIIDSLIDMVADSQVLIENRSLKIESVLHDKEYVPVTKEEIKRKMKNEKKQKSQPQKNENDNNSI